MTIYPQPPIFQIQSMDLLFDRDAAAWQGIVIKFHMFQFARVVPPSIITKVMQLVPVTKVGQTNKYSESSLSCLPDLYWPLNLRTDEIPRQLPSKLFKHRSLIESFPHSH